MSGPAGMSCLALVTDAFGGYGGIAQYNRDFLGAVAACQRVSLVQVLPRHAANRASPDKIKQAPERPGRLRYSLAALAAACRRRPDIVFCGHLFMAPLAAAIAWITGARLIVQAHGIEAWTVPSPIQRLAVEAADLVLCVSRHTRAAVLGWAAITPERIVVVPDTVGDVFAPGDGSARRAAWRLNGKRVLLTVGRLDPRERYKGHDRVIQLVPDLVARGHDIAYVVIGEGEDRHRLKDLAQSLGVGERVRFTGAVSQDTLVQAYRMADLYVMPSTGEGFGIAFLEAMASGTPALGLAVAGARDALADGELGTMVAETELPSALDCLLGGPRADPAALANRVRARFGRAAFGDRVALALDRLCGPAPA